VAKQIDYFGNRDGTAGHRRHESREAGGLILTGAVSINTSSAACTAASRTKSVRDRPRKDAARSIIAMSVSGSRTVTGYPLRLIARGM
jgi:hypothetical protein